MFLTKNSVPRRTILRGMGAAVALPLLDAMIPAATAQSAVPNPRRAGFIYIPHGADMGSWTPTVDGTKLTLSPSLKALAPYQKQLTVITNLKRAGTVQEMHAAAASGWLSGAIPKATEARTTRSARPSIKCWRAKLVGRRRCPRLSLPPRISPATWAAARLATAART